MAAAGLSVGQGGGGRSILTSRGGGKAPPSPSCDGAGDGTEGKGGSGRWDAGAELRCGRTAVAQGNAGPGGGAEGGASGRAGARAQDRGLGGYPAPAWDWGEGARGRPAGAGAGGGAGARAGRRACVRPPLPRGLSAPCVRTRAVPRRRLGVRSARARLGGAPVRCPLRRGRVGARSPRPGALQPLTWSELSGGRASVCLFIFGNEAGAGAKGERARGWKGG